MFNNPELNIRNFLIIPSQEISKLLKKGDVSINLFMWTIDPNKDMFNDTISDIFVY